MCTQIHAHVRCGPFFSPFEFDIIVDLFQSGLYVFIYGINIFIYIFIQTSPHSCLYIPKNAYTNKHAHTHARFTNNNESTYMCYTITIVVQGAIKRKSRMNRPNAVV